MAIEQQNGDYNLYASAATVFNKTATADGEWELDIRIGDGAKNLHTNAATLTLVVTVNGCTIGGGSASTEKGAAILRAALRTGPIFIASGQAMTATLQSNNSNDTDVDVTVTPRLIQTNTVQINGSSLAAKVLAAERYGYKSDAVMLVENGSNETERGNNLWAAYTQACSLSPGGNALSATNRAIVLIPPGRYLVGLKTLGTNYVDLVALVDPVGSARHETYWPNVFIHFSGVGACFTQVATDIRLRGLYVEYFYTSPATSYAASRYSDCRFGSCVHSNNVSGHWANCCSDGYSWQCGIGGVFNATMNECHAFLILGTSSPFGGDTGVGFGSCYLYRCTGKYGTFGGCASVGISVSADAVFIECESGDHGFCHGKKNEGTYIRCRGGACSFGGTSNVAYDGEFAGYAEDCIGGPNSFGGTETTGYGKLSGRIVNCTSLRDTKSRRLEGALIDGCIITQDTDDVDCITLLDSNSCIHNSTLLVAEGGTGVPINSASAMSVSAAGNRYNNKAVAATGLGENVTNVGTSEIQGKLPADGALMHAAGAAVAKSPATLDADDLSDAAASKIVDALFADVR
jgi:hypothetical protein